MYDRILAPTDGSRIAERAGEHACELARRFGADLSVATVLEDDDRERAERAVDAVAEHATERGVDAMTEILDREASVAETVIEYATDHDVDCIVMGTQGRSGLDRFLLGSVAEELLRESPLPVVTVTEGADPRPDLERVLVATDGSDSATAATDHAIELATEAGATLHVVHVTDALLAGERETVEVAPGEEIGTDAIDDVLERAQGTDLETIHTAVVPGRTHQAILAYATEHDVDAIVMGTHGRTGLGRYLLGSTTERVVRFATVPVTGVRPEPGPTTTVEYLDYQVLEEQGWSLEDEDLFEQAAEADLGEDAYGTLEVEQGEYVLDAAEAEGEDWPFYCRVGGCVDCTAAVLEGDLEMDENRQLSDEEVEEKGFRLTCVGTPTTEEVTLVYNVKHHEDLQDRVM